MGTHQCEFQGNVTDEQITRHLEKLKLSVQEQSIEDAFKLETILRRSSARSEIERDQFEQESVELATQLCMIQDERRHRQSHAKLQISQMRGNKHFDESFGILLHTFKIRRQFEEEKLKGLAQIDALETIRKRLNVRFITVMVVQKIITVIVIGSV